MTLQEILSGKEENHILPFFWQRGEDEETLRHYMHVIHDANIGAVCVESRPHPDFCGPKWWADMDAILDEAKKLGMKVWILDDAHFPTGYANGAAANADPSLCRESLVMRFLTIPEGEDSISFSPADYREAEPWAPNYIEGFVMQSQPAPRHYDDDRLIAAVAIKQGGTEADLIDLSAYLSEDTVRFVKPDQGEWKIALMNLSRNFGPHRNYINMMDERSCRLLLDAVYEPHWAHYSEEFGKTIAGFFSDEPEIGNGHLYEFDKKIGELSDQAWSDRVGEGLQEKWGVNYTKYLPLIFNQDFDPDLQARIRCDYMDTVTRLVEKCFSFQLGDWCRAHGVMYIGHLIEDSHQHLRTVSSLGHYFRGLAGQDMAGIDNIGGQIQPQGEAGGKGDFMHPVRDGEFWHYTLGKLAASMAAIDPLKQGRAMCENFGNYGWSEGVRLEKYLADHLMVRGINNFVPHAFSAQPYPDPDCPPHFYAQGNNPQYRHFGELMKYMNRVCTLISGGRATVPAALLYNAEADWAGEQMYLQKPGHALYDHQIDYHFIPADVFTEEKYSTVLSDGLSVNGQKYRVLIVPYMEYIPKAAAEAALKLSNQGFPVVFIDGLPKATIEGGTPDPLIAALQKEAEREAVFVAALSDLVTVLQDRFGIRDAVLSPESTRIRVLHYQGEHEFYYILNEASEGYQGTVSLPEEGPWSLYDAWNNVIIGVYAGKEIPVALCPSKSVFAVKGDFADEKRKAEIAADAAFFAQAEASDFSEGWQRSICRSINYPDFSEAKEISLPDTLAEEEPKFSGFVRYEKDLTVEAENGIVPRIILQITDAYEGIEVFVNGESLGIQIVPQYLYDLTPYLQPGTNHIRIEAATTLEREGHDFPSRFTQMGIEMPPSTVPSGINGKVLLIR